MRSVFRLFIAFILFVTLPSCGPITFTVGSDPGAQRIDETVVIGDGGSNRVAMIDVSGLLINARRRGLLDAGENPVASLTESLNAAAADSRVKAVILRLNTPGGTVTASDAMYREVMRFKQRTGKPVVTMMMDVTASGGYYLACGTDRIVAYPTTITASIGVIVQTVSFKPLMDRWGIAAEAFTSGPNKAAGSPLETMTDEHRAIFRGLVDDFYQRFTALVRENRPNIPADKFAMVTDGRIVTGVDALELGLVDELGDVYDAWAAAKKLAGVRHADLVRLHREGQTVRSVYADSPVGGAGEGAGAGGVTQVNLMQINLSGEADAATAAFLYLWRPGLP